MTAIACDIDGVVANFTKGFSILCHRLDSRLPLVEYGQANTWCWWREKWYTDHSPRGQVVPEEAWALIQAADSDVMFWLGLEPLFNLSYLQKVYNEWPVHFMTRRDGGMAEQQTRLWLERNGMPWARVSLIPSGVEKSEVCAKLGISTIIEDSPTYAQEALDAGMNVVLVTYQYNVHVPKQERLRRVFNLERALVVAKEMNDE